MSLLGKMVQGAKVFGSGQFIDKGTYTFAVERMFEQKGYEGECFIAELRVLKSEAIDPQVKPNPVGSTASVVYNVTKQGDAAKGNIKEIIMKLYGLGEDDIDEALYEHVISEANPTRGMLLDARTIEKINQGRKNPAKRGEKLIVPKWQTVEGQWAAGDDGITYAPAVAEMRAELDKRTAGSGSAPAAKPEPEPPPVAKKTGGLSFLKK